MRRRIRRLLQLLLVLLAAVFLAFLMLRSRYRDVIRDLAETQVKNTTSDLTNDAIAKQIADGASMRHDGDTKPFILFDNPCNGPGYTLKNVAHGLAAGRRKIIGS